MRSYMHMRRLFTNGISRVSISFGKTCSFMVAIMAILITIEVVRRYVFNDPTTWSLELVTIMSGAVYTLTAAYTLSQKGHIRVDLLSARMSPRLRAIIELVSLPLFVAFVGTLLWGGWQFTWVALVQGQTGTSQWAPTIWPAKLVIPVGAFLLLLQALPKYLADVELLIKGKVEE